MGKGLELGSQENYISMLHANEQVSLGVMCLTGIRKTLCVNLDDGTRYSDSYNAALLILCRDCSTVASHKVRLLPWTSGPIH
jgi:hypothetical protein